MVSGVMRLAVVAVLLIGYVLAMPAEEDTRKVRPEGQPQGGLADAGSIHEEVVVGAQLYVRKKPATALRRQQREIRHHDHLTHSTSHVNRLESPGKEQPLLGKHHHKVAPSWKNTKANTTKVNQHSRQ
uniref:Secreted protein n=1 Tax=Anopheles farauti TaxID=69004 RepID=A0A182QMN1_9DIPT